MSEKPTSGVEWYRRTFQYRTGLGLTPELKAQYEKDYAHVKQKDDCNKCYEYRDWVLKFSPTVIFMIQQIEKVGKGTPHMMAKQGESTFDTSKIVCDVCDDMKAGGFHPSLGILLCSNRLRDKYHVEDTLAHELVHYYDSIKFPVDWLNLKHHACSEIRASSLSGECRLMNEFWKGALGKVGKGHQECVRRRATLSVMANPKCEGKEHAERVVGEVWDSCFNDTRPFDEIYR